MPIPAPVLRSYNAGLSPKGNDEYNRQHNLGTVQMHALFRATKAHKYGVRSGRVSGRDVKAYVACLTPTQRTRYGCT
jgi:hypothetical protein